LPISRTIGCEVIYLKIDSLLWFLFPLPIPKHEHEVNLMKISCLGQHPLKSLLNSLIPSLLIGLLSIFPSMLSAVGLDEGLVARYPFEGNAQDVSGNNLHGSVHGATLTSDRFGNANSAYQFDGNDYIEIQDNPLLDFTEAFTISLWINQSQAQASGYRLVDKTTAGVNDGYNFDTYDGKTGQQMRLTGGTQNVSAKSVYALNKWHHLVVVFAKGTSTFYLDGVVDGSGEHGAAMQTNNLTVRIGTAHGSRAETFKGVIDDLRFYKRALSEPEVKVLNDLFPAPSFSCEPKKKCGEMDSCEEAHYHLQQCRRKNLDRDKDGIPCESICKE